MKCIKKNIKIEALKGSVGLKFNLKLAIYFRSFKKIIRVIKKMLDITFKSPNLAGLILNIAINKEVN